MDGPTDNNTDGQDLGLTTIGDRNDRGILGEGGDMYYPSPEQICTVYCH